MDYNTTIKDLVDEYKVSVDELINWLESHKAIDTEGDELTDWSDPHDTIDTEGEPISHLAKRYIRILKKAQNISLDDIINTVKQYYQANIKTMFPKAVLYNVYFNDNIQNYNENFDLESTGGIVVQLSLRNVPPAQKAQVLAKTKEILASLMVSKGWVKFADALSVEEV